MNLINELRMLAEDLYSAGGHSRYAAALSKAADELGSLERYRTAYNEWIAKTEWVQADTTLPAKYLGMHRADVLKDLISELEERLKDAEAEALEEARLNGMGAEREAALMAKLEAAEKERDNANAAAAGIALQAETLQAERDALRAENEPLAANLRGKHSTTGATYAHLIAERDALRAKIEVTEKQEPVAFALYSGWFRKAVYLSEIEACEQRDRRQLTADLGGSLEAYRVVPLYLAPGAQPAPSIPEGWPTDEMTTAFAAVFNVRDQQATFAPAFRAALAASTEAKP